MTNPLIALEVMAAAGMQPVRREVWLGLGFRPPKRNAIELNPARIPTLSECWPVVGLDIIVVYQGSTTRYGPLRSLCGSLVAARPRRLLAIDLDAKRVAYLKLGAS